MTRLPFRIRLGVTGEPDLVEVNGVDVTGKVSRVSVDTVHAEDGVPKVYLEVREGGTIEGEGIVTQNVVVKGGAATAAWLLALNPREVEEALMKDELADDFDSSVAQRVIGHLAKLAGADGG